MKARVVVLAAVADSTLVCGHVEWPAAEKAVEQAVAKGWLIVEAGYSVCLTEAGRKP